MVGAQEFDVVDVLRLQIQDGWPDLPNDVLNPSGVGGAWGWQLSSVVPDEPNTLTADATGLTFETGTTYDTGTETGVRWRVPITEVEATGQQVRAAVDMLDVDPGTLAEWRVEFTNVVLAESTSVVFPDPLALGTNDLPPTDIPVGTIRITLQYAVPGPFSSHSSKFNEAWMVHGSAADVVASDPLTDPPWTDVLGSAAELTVERDEMNVGTLAATLYDATLDPASFDLIRPGKRFRLQAHMPFMLIDDIAYPPRWESLIEGKLENPSSVYEVRDPKRPDGKRVQIKLMGSDVIGDLANVPAPEGVGTMAELPYVLLGTGVASSVNGDTGAVDPEAVEVVSWNDAAKAVDQIVMTRDSVLGFAWVDRKGVVQLWDRGELPQVPRLTLDEDDYSDLSTDWDVDRTFNTLTVELLDVRGASTTYGPYVDESAKREWRGREATFRVHGLDPDAIDGYAADILALNAQPAKRINSVTLPIRTQAELEARALTDLYDLVSVSNDLAEITDQQSRIVSLKHRITIKREGARLVNRWWLDIGFAPDNGDGSLAGVAPPQVTPAAKFGASLLTSISGDVTPMDYKAKGTGTDNDQTALENCFYDAALKGLRVIINRPYGFDGDLLHRGGFVVFQTTPRRLPAAGVIDYLEPGLIAVGDEARYRFGQTGDGSGSMNDNPGPVYNLCVDGAGIAGAEGLFYCDAAQSSLYDLMVMNVVDDGIALRVGRSQNLNFFNPQIGPNNGIGVQLKAIAGQQGPGHVVFYGGHIHDNSIGVSIAGTAGDFFPPHDNLFKGTLIESGRVAGQPIQVAIQAHAGLGTVFEDVNVTYGAQVGGLTGNDVSDDCSVLINNTQFPAYSTHVVFRGGTIGGGINKVTDAIRVRQDVAGAANKLVLEKVGFANVDNMICVDGEHGSDPDFADPIVEINSVYEITGVTAFSRAINNGTRLNHGNETPLGIRYELPTGLTNGLIQNPLVVKHEDEPYARYSIDWNGQVRWFDPTTGAVVGTMARNGSVWGPGGQFVIGASFGFTATSTNIGSNTGVTIDAATTARHELVFTVGGVNVTSLAISNGVTGRKLMLSILGSGGANTITWPASSVIQFRTTAPQPIAGVRQYVELEYVGTKWFEVSRSG